MLRMLAVGSVIDWNYTENETSTQICVRVLVNEKYTTKEGEEKSVQNLLVCHVYRKNENKEEFLKTLKKNSLVFVEAEMPKAESGVNTNTGNTYSYFVCKNIKNFLHLSDNKNGQNYLKIIGTGNLCSDAVIKNMDNQRDAINFSLGFNAKRTDTNGNVQEETQFVSCGMFRPAGKTTITDYLKKGLKILVEGKPVIRIGVNNEGSSVSYFNAEITNIEFLGRKQEESTAAPVSSFASQEADFYNNDLPF